MPKYHVMLEDGSGDFFADAMVEASGELEAANKAMDVAESLEWSQRDYELDLSNIMVLDTLFCAPKTETTCTAQVEEVSHD